MPLKMTSLTKKTILTPYDMMPFFRPNDSQPDITTLIRQTLNHITRFGNAYRTCANKIREYSCQWLIEKYGKKECAATRQNYVNILYRELDLLESRIKAIRIQIQHTHGTRTEWASNPFSSPYRLHQNLQQVASDWTVTTRTKVSDN